MNCQYCDRTFTTLGELVTHLEAHRLVKGKAGRPRQPLTQAVVDLERAGWNTDYEQRTTSARERTARSRAKWRDWAKCETFEDVCAWLKAYPDLRENNGRRGGTNET